MNKYKIELKATDSAGIKFLEQVVKFANMGASIDTAYPTKNSFPNKVMLSVETEEFLEDDVANGMRVYPVELQYSKEYLESLPIEDMRPLVAQKGVKGRDKTKMIKQYLEACRGIVSESSEEDE